MLFFIFNPITFILLICVIVYVVMYLKEKKISSDAVRQVEASYVTMNTKDMGTLYYVNKFEYKYIVDGIPFTGNDKEMFLFKQKRNPNPTEKIMVEYLIKNPKESRLTIIDRKAYRKTILIAVCFILVLSLFIIKQ